ncbi:MAG: cysteine desulfurase [Candidatus Methylomirabilis oxygeniifera]|uniref:cysteine desulfurase n=1 Tax=Methylomirabilis oxygeniifera TaxID=671143 RepID=D5MLX3_METO1|nr:MAG: cysteine desulfurase [Candidatus Methylomirabilis oxyfera]CBE70030.1 cysteine desulfurase (Nitrogenase metalloclusters biosynthesis protein nifS) [Candidatus Methylomirabilis oxyfera]
MGVYLDYNATTPMRFEAVEAMRPYLESHFGNASSGHSRGREAKRALEEAREALASALVVREKASVVFVSGGTEADNLAVKGAAWAARERGRHIVTSVVEHHAVLGACRTLETQGFDVTYLPVDTEGLIDPEGVKQSLRADTTVISLMHANNETGVICPVAEIGQLARERGIIFHTDAVQAFGRLPIDVEALGVDLLTISGHKIYGPKGIGALYVRPGVEVLPQIHGGGQEHGVRAGTENVAAAVGMACATRLTLESMPTENRRLRALRDRLEDGILGRIPGARRNGDRDQRLPNTTNISFRGIQADALMVALDLEGVEVSAGAACAAGSIEISHVLRAMGRRPEIDGGGIRFSLGAGTTEAEIERVLTLLPPLVEQIHGATLQSAGDRVRA